MSSFIYKGVKTDDETVRGNSLNRYMTRVKPMFAPFIIYRLGGGSGSEKLFAVAFVSRGTGVGSKN